MRFRKKPVEIEAIRWDGENVVEILEFTKKGSAGIGIEVCSSAGSTTIKIHTLEGVMTASVGDWIIRGVKGELYPCKDDIFMATYDAVMEDEEEEEGDVDSFNVSIQTVVEDSEGSKWYPYLMSYTLFEGDFSVVIYAMDDGHAEEVLQTIKHNAVIDGRLLMMIDN